MDDTDIVDKEIKYWYTHVSRVTLKQKDTVPKPRGTQVILQFLSKHYRTDLMYTSMEDIIIHNKHRKIINTNYELAQTNQNYLSSSIPEKSILN